MEVKGHNGTVTFDGNFVTIVRKGGLARITVGKGDKRIPLHSVTSVQIKPAGAMVNGYIEFTMSGGDESNSKFGSATIDAVKNENAVIFTKKQMPEFLALREAVEQAMVQRHAPAAPVAAAPNVAEQIGQLAALRDQGILDEAEFQAKKRQLLERM